MSRPNTCIKDENGKEYWISRSSVVIPIVFKGDSEGNIYTLLEKRGPAVSHPGEWCCPCGYIDWDEDLEEACRREVKEETGLDLGVVHFFETNTDKFSKNQTIDHWYMCLAKDYNQELDINNIESKDEILDLKWLKVAKISKTGLFKNKNLLTIYKGVIDRGYGKWAFRRHHRYIFNMLNSTTNCKIKVEL